MKITAGVGGGYSAQLMQAGAVLRLGGRGLAIFLHNEAGVNPSLIFSPPPSLQFLRETPEDDLRAVLRRRAAESPSARGLRRPLAVLIENVNDDGFLEWSEPMREELERQFGGEPTEAAVFALQTLSPPGVGARDLSECLLLQIKSRRLALLNNSADSDSDSKPGANSDSELEEKLAVLAAAEKIAAERLRWFLRRRMDKLPKRRLAAAAEVLESLSFRPGAAAGDAEAESAATALTDVEFYWRRGLWRARPGTADWIPAAARRPGGDYRRARQIVAAVAARRRHLLKLAQLAADRQAIFFQDGAAAMRPFPMRRAAEELGVTPAMVSHIAADKYFLANGRVYALKSLFARWTPGGYAAAAAQARIQQLVASENASRPHSDLFLQNCLRRSGLPLARRTVGKYRAAVGIARASLRKRPSG